VLLTHFFLYTPFSQIHVPHAHADRWAHSSHKNTTFFDTLRELDNHVGEIISMLTDLGVENNTFVFLTADNGPWVVKCQLAGSQGPFQGIWQFTNGGGGSTGKDTVWEAGHRVLGLAYWPTKIKPGISHAIGSSLDLLPTIASLSGITLPTDRSFDGIDISPILFDGATTGHTTLFHPFDQSIDAVRYNQYKLFYTTRSQPGCGSDETGPKIHNPPLVFDLSVDPYESTPLDPAPQDVIDDATGALNAFLKDVQTTPHTVTDFSTNANAQACCNKTNSNCRC